MNSKKMIVPVIAIVSACIAALGFVLVLLAALLEYDTSIGHFIKNAVFAPSAGEFF